jgi:hypothetical protein
MNVRIEVAAAPGMSTAERGRLLEQFARKFLVSQNFCEITEVRSTGQEVDVTMLAIELQIETCRRVWPSCSGSVRPLTLLRRRASCHDGFQSAGKRDARTTFESPGTWSGGYFSNQRA